MRWHRLATAFHAPVTPCSRGFVAQSSHSFTVCFQNRSFDFTFLTIIVYKVHSRRQAISRHVLLRPRKRLVILHKKSIGFSTPCRVAQKSSRGLYRAFEGAFSAMPAPCPRAIARGIKIPRPANSANAGSPPPSRATLSPPLFNLKFICKHIIEFQGKKRPLPITLFESS